jgi:NitT/TauT family transport system permease protein
VWQVAIIISDGWVPSIAEIGEALIEGLVTVSVYEQIWITFRRILITFVASTVVGVAIGVAVGLNHYLRMFFRPLIAIGLSIPDPVYIILAILVLGTREASGLIALIVAIVPFVVTIAAGAVNSRDRGLDEMSSVYSFNRRQYLVEVVGRQISPALFAAARTSFSLSWKLVVLVEALSQPQGIGAQIYQAFRLLRPAEMIALALIFIVVMQLVEILAFKPLERRFMAWL